MLPMEQIEAVVIGAGVVGLAVGRALALAGREVLVVESENAIGTGTSSRNSEVIHAGIYYPAGSLKARLCVQGKQMLYAYCAERGVAHRQLGKLIVATSPEQVLALDGIMAKAAANGTPRNAHLFSTSLVTLVILMNSSRTMASMFEFLILLTTAISLVIYFGCAAAAFRLIQTGILKVGAGFKVILLLAAIYSCWTIYGAGTEALLWGIALLLAGFPVFWLLRLARGSKAAT